MLCQKLLKKILNFVNLYKTGEKIRFFSSNSSGNITHSTNNMGNTQILCPVFNHSDDQQNKNVIF